MEKRELAFLMYTEVNHNSDIVRFRAPVVVLTDEGIRNPGSSIYDREDLHLAGLQIRAQADSGSHGPFYGYDLIYDHPYEVELRRAEAMVKLLRKVDRTLTVLQKLGVKVGAGGWSYDENTYRWMDVMGLHSQIETMLREARPGVGVTA